VQGLEISIRTLEERLDDVLVHRAGQVQVQLLVQVPASSGPVTPELSLEVGNAGQNGRVRGNFEAILRVRKDGFGRKLLMASYFQRLLLREPSSIVAATRCA
jgi:hypothetical protein